MARRSVVIVFVMTGLFIVTMFLGASSVMAAAELRLLVVGHPADLNNYLMDEVIPAFEEKYGVKVFMDVGSWSNRIDKILVSIAGGVPYDVVATGYYAPYEEGSSGLLMPLDRYIDQWEKKDLFPPPLWEATKWKGEIYHVPHTVSLRGMAYNKGLFGEAGLDADTPPDSWDGLIEAARWLTRIEGDQVAVRGLNLNDSNHAQVLFWFMRQAGISEINSDDFTSNLNRPEALDALHTLADIAEASRYRDPVIGGGQFVHGRAAMQMNNPANFFTLSDQNPDLVDDYAVFAPRRSPDSPPVAHGFVNGLAILEASHHKDLAWNFIATLHEDDIRLEIKRMSGYISGRIDMVPDYMEIAPKIDQFYDLFTHLQATMIPPPRNESQSAVVDLVRQVYQVEIPPETALIQADALWTRLLKAWEETF